MRQAQRLAVHLLEPMLEHWPIGLPQQLVVDHDLVVGTNPEQILIERGVVDLAECDSVHHDRVATGLGVGNY